MSSGTRNLLYGLGLLILGALLGYFLSGGMNNKKSLSPSGQPNNQLFTSESAVINGKITKIVGKVLTVEGNNKQSGTFDAADNITVIDLTVKSNPQATPSSDLTKVKLNTDAVLFLQKINGSFKVVSVQISPVLKIAPPKLTPVKP